MFVANCVELMHTLTSVSQWRHVGSKDNPADVASRGMGNESMNMILLICGLMDRHFCCVVETGGPSSPAS